MNGKLTWIAVAVAVLTVLVAALQAVPDGPLDARVAHDAVLYGDEGQILGRMRAPGRRKMVFSCSHAEGEEESVVMVMETRRRDAGAEDAEEADPPLDWRAMVQRGGRTLAEVDLAGEQNDKQVDREFEFRCSHEQGAEHEARLLLRAFPETDLLVGGHRVTAEVMNTPRKRSWGLQGRADLPEDYGMWFVYDEPDHAVFVMKTVSFPISIAFVRAGGVITNVERLNPGDLRRARSLERVQFVLEMEQGWFEEHDVGAGSVVKWPAVEEKNAGEPEGEE
jgi:hypothetical protein